MSSLRIIVGRIFLLIVAFICLCIHWGDNCKIHVDNDKTVKTYFTIIHMRNFYVAFYKIKGLRGPSAY